MKCFNVTKYQLTINTELHIIDIKKIDDSLEILIDDCLVNICEGDSDSIIDDVKKDLVNFFKTQSDNIIAGSIAEFFTHLYLKTLNYKQECLYENLEENSIKKGFDGLYSKKNETWIMESKSGFITTQKITHKAKIKESYEDLREKFDGKVKNNPWKNAFNHAQLKSVNTEDSILKEIKRLSNDFRNGIFPNIQDYNIIPSATIFLDGKWVEIPKDKIRTDVDSILNDLEYNNAMIICITKKSVELFLDYIRR